MIKMLGMIRITFQQVKGASLHASENHLPEIVTVYQFNVFLPTAVHG